MEGFGKAFSLLCGVFTLLLHFLMVDVSSLTTMSTHFKDGSFSFCICFFTMVSKARSGVKRPVLHDDKEQGRWEGGREGEEAMRREGRREADRGRRESEREREKRRREKKTQGKQREK